MQGQTNHKAPEARASGPADWRGPELEGYQIFGASDHLRHFHAHGMSFRSAYATLGYHGLLSTNIWKHTYSLSRFETTAHLWHLWFICAVYKFTYLLAYLVAATFGIQVGLTLEPGTRFKHYQIVATIVWPTPSCVIWHRGPWTHMVSMSPTAGHSRMTIPVIWQRNIPAWSQHEEALGFEVPWSPGNLSPPLIWCMMRHCSVRWRISRKWAMS